jgi:hypothetical protein
MAMEEIQSFLENAKGGAQQTHRNMTLFLLLASDTAEPDYLILEEALGQGVVEITEVSQGGSVPELKLINRSTRKLLIVDGEELVGAKQNRIVDATFLIAGRTEITIPVSCVEQGRWPRVVPSSLQPMPFSPSSSQYIIKFEPRCPEFKGNFATWQML